MHPSLPPPPTATHQSLKNQLMSVAGRPSEQQWYSTGREIAGKSYIGSIPCSISELVNLLNSKHYKILSCQNVGFLSTSYISPVAVQTSLFLISVIFTRLEALFPSKIKELHVLLQLEHESAL